MSALSLWNAPFRKKLQISGIELPEESKRILVQMGIDQGEALEKLHSAPLGDPVSVLIGSQQFALRQEICQKIYVEVL
jgi:Fe2+ transport system protein FeoA